MRRAAVVLVLLLLSQSAAAAPPPGEAEVANDICSTWETSSGVCDDYDSALDSSPSSGTWVEGTVELEIETAEAIEMVVSLAIHELPRGDLDLFDLDLEGDSNPSSGIPADYIRNYRDLARSDGESVEDKLVEKIEEIIQAIVDENFPDAEMTPVQPLSIIEFATREDVHCSYDPTSDSIDESNGIANDPFNPPICLKAHLSLMVEPTNLGMDPNTGDVDRMMRGLLRMGAHVESNFTTIAEAGQLIEYRMLPPLYAQAASVAAPGLLLQRTPAGQTTSQRYSAMAIDNLAGSPLAAPASLLLRTELTHYDGTSTGPSSDVSGSELTLELVVDARDRMNTRFDLDIEIHHLWGDTLVDWGVDLGSSSISMPLLTADGIRMFDTELDSDIEQILDAVPIEALSHTFSQALGAEVGFQPPSFAPANLQGGLMFTHRGGETCDENLPFRYCVDGRSAMSGEYPVVLQTTSMPSTMHITQVVQQLIARAQGDISTIDLSIVNDEDLAAMMSVLEIKMQTDAGWLQDLLPEDFPQTDIRIVLHLPDWVDSTIGDPNTIVLDAPSSGSSREIFGFTGSRPFDWQHAICLESGRGGIGDPSVCSDESEDMICGSNQKTCVSFDVEIDIERFAIRETRAAIELEFSADITLELYRLGLVEKEEHLSLEPIPADLIRRIIAIGDRREGGLLAGSSQKAILPLSTGEKIEFEISNQGLQDLSVVITEEVERSFSQFEEMGAQDVIVGNQRYSSNFDISAIPFVLDIEAFEMPPDMELTDTNPIRLGARIETSSLTLSLTNNQFGVRIAPAALGTSLLESLAERFGLKFSDTGVTLEDGLFRSYVPPIMEHTPWGTIRTSARFEIHLPDTIRLTSFESRLGLAELSEENGRQVLRYQTPVCPTANSWVECWKEKDTITWEVEVTYALILGELAPYLFILAVFIGLAGSRWKRNRDQRNAEKRDAASALEQQLLELEFAAQMGELDERIVIETDSADQSEFL